MAWALVGCRLGRETQSCCSVGGGGINRIMTGTSDIHGVTPRGQALFNEVSIFYLLICSFITQNIPKS